jgi:hypothetical protein
MGVTSIIDKLGLEPVNCGNCLEMKTDGMPDDEKVFAQCQKGCFDNRKFRANGGNRLPEVWNRAKMCPDFDIMIDQVKEGVTWSTIGRKY